MPIRVRKLIGAALIISFVVVYALVAMALAQARFLQEASGLMQFVYYLLLGLGWVLPLMPLIAWMSRGDGPRP